MRGTTKILLVGAFLLLLPLTAGAEGQARPVNQPASPSPSIQDQTPEYDSSCLLYPEAAGLPKNHLRPMAELGLPLVAGMAWYYTEDDNQDDQVLDGDFQTLLDKLSGREVYFDGNSFDLNGIGHPLAGTAYYLIARSNALSIGESFLYTAGMTVFWESAVEFEEKGSANDLLLTPLGGLAMGEVAAQLGEFFTRSRPTTLNKAVSWSLGLPRRIHRRLDGLPEVHSEEYDRWGFTRDMWHRFDITAGTGPADLEGQNRWLYWLDLDLETVNVSTYGRDGSADRFLTDGNFARLKSRLTMTGVDVQGFGLTAKSGLAGWYRQEVVRDAASELSGYSFFLGPGAAFDYTMNLIKDDNLRQATVKAGPNCDLNYYAGGYKLRWINDAYVGFSQIDAFALPAYLALHQGQRPQGALTGNSYYFGWGVEALSELRLSRDDWEIRAFGDIQYYDCLYGMGLYQHENGDEEGIEDLKIGWGLSWRYALVPDWVKLFAGLEGVRRTGRIGGFEDQGSETLTQVGLVFSF